MLLKLLDLNKIPIEGLNNCKDLKIESTLLPYDKVLSFLWHSNKMKLPHEHYLRTETDEFVIKENSKSSNGYRKIVANLNLEELEGKVWESFGSTEHTVKECADAAVVGTGWRVEPCGITKTRNITLTKVSSLDIITKICQAYMCEVRYDTIQKKIYFAEKIGSDRGAYFVKDLNLKELTDSNDTYDYCTRILPVGKDGIKIAGVNNGKDYVENYQYSSKVKTIIWEDDKYEKAEDLKSDAVKKLAELSKPKISYQSKVIDLSKISQKYAVLEYSLGDEVSIIENETNTREKQRIVKMTEYPNSPEKNTCELANAILTFEEMQKKIDEAVDIVENVTTDNGTIKGSSVDKIVVKQIPDFESECSNIVTLYVQESAVIKDLQAESVYVSGELGAVKATIGEIETTYLKATEADIKYLTAEQANIDYIKGEYVEANYAKISALEAVEGSFQNLVTENIEAVNGKFNNLNSQYAEIDLANIKNGCITTAMIGTGVIGTTQIEDGSITNGKIIDLTANKITAGTLDAANIDVINLNCANLTVGTINGQQIAPGAIDMGNLSESLSGDIKNTIDDVDKALKEAGLATGTAEEAVDIAKTAKTLTAILSNESHLIPTDQSGAHGNYDGCESMIFVYYGTSDVTAESTYAIEESSGVTGIWDNTLKQYTVSSLAEDLGYVDIAAFYKELSIKKRFDFSKNKQGPQGPQGNQGGQGPQGNTGATGSQGPQGTPGPKGTDGQTTYFHVRYSQNANGNPMVPQATGAIYMGVCTTTSSTAPVGYASYTWSRIKGETGSQGNTGSTGATGAQGPKGDVGTQGPKGTDGKPTYLHIKYSDNGTSFTANAGETPGKWIGQYVDSTELDSTTFGAYSWKKIEGPQGNQGGQGPQGNTGATGSQGPQGQSGRTYFIESTTFVIKKGYDNAFAPTSVTFNSFYRDGTTAGRTAYAGRFVIQETVDGTTYTTKYTSSANEGSKAYSPSGATVKGIKCTLYVAGATTTALDTQNVAILTDIDNIKPTLDQINKDISGSQTTANGKNSVFYQTSAPAATDRKTNDIWYDTDDGNKMYYFNGSTWVATQFGTNAIASLSITDALIANAAISNAKIANLDAAKITTGTLSADRIAANSIAGDKITGNTITGGKIAGSTITAVNILSGTITTDKINAKAITTALLDTDAVTADKILAGEITTAKIATSAITANKIAAGAVTVGKLDANSVVAVNIQSGAITADKIDVNAIKSKTFADTSGVYSSSGTFFNLAGAGAIKSKNFAIDVSGNAYFRGNVDAASGSVGGWTLTAQSIVKQYTDSGNIDHWMYFDAGPANPNYAAIMLRTKAHAATAWDDQFQVTWNGRLIAKNADIKGTIDATDIRVRNSIKMYANEYVGQFTVLDYIPSGVNQGLSLTSPGQLRISASGSQITIYDLTDFKVPIQEQGTPLSDKYMRMRLENGYWGLAPQGNNNVWVRTTAQGIIPFKAGNAGAGSCSLGTSSWYFSAAYVDNIYEKGTALSDKYATSSHKHSFITNGTSEWVSNSNGTLMCRTSGVWSPKNIGSSGGTTCIDTLYYKGSLTKVSDRRSKTNIKELDTQEALSLLSNMKVKTFSYNGDENKLKNYGIIAQDLRDYLTANNLDIFAGLVINQCNDETNVCGLDAPEENVNYGVDYTQFISPLIVGFQNILKKNEELSSKLDDEHRRNEELEARIERLEKLLLP